MDNVDVLKKSVTEDDYNSYVGAGAGIMHFMLPTAGASPDLPGFWSYSRDWSLYNTIYRESMWASAVYLAVTKQASKSWEVDSDVPKRQKDAQRLFLHFGGGNGWTPGISKHLQAYILTGNGGPVEIVRASGAPGAKVLGLVPLDPFRTFRTGNVQIPYLYVDRRGAQHELKDYECFCITDQPDVNDLWYGVGHCAAERAYKAIQKLEAIERFIYEKVSGNRALALDFVSGVVPTQINDAINTSRNESAAKGVYTYLGSTIIALAGDQAPTHVRINLAELPDGFQRKEEFDIAVLTYARALGIPVQDLQPLSGQGLGTGAQTQVLEESAKGQGMATWGKAFSHAANEFALDDKTTFYFRENDIRDREREAKVKIDEATAIGTWVTMQAITIEQARQLGVDRDQLPAEFIPQDVTPGGTLSDSEKPVDESEVTPEDTEIPITQPTEQTAGEPVLDESDAILKTAKEIYQSIAGGNVGDSHPAYLERMLDQQGKLIDALAARPVSTPNTSHDALAETARKAVDIAYKRIEESDSVLAREMKETRESIQASIDKQAHELRSVNKEAREMRNALDTSDSVTGEVLREMIGAMDNRARDSAVQLETLRSALDSKPSAATLKQLAESAAVQAAEQVWTNTEFKHTEDLAVRNEIVERDRNGLASLIERTLASGQRDRFRVIRSNGSLQRLEKV